MPRLRWSPSGAPTTPCTGAARAGSEAISNPAAPPNSARRPMPSAADIESAAVEGVDVGLTKAARVARQRMFEGGERQPGLCQRARVAARQMRMEHPGGEGIAGAGAVDDAGDADFVRLVRSVPQEIGRAHV